MLVSEEQVTAGSYQAYAKMVTAASGNQVLNRDALVTKRVRDIAHRIIPHAVNHRTQALGWKWEVHVFESDIPNAFCMAGGKIGVNSGMVTKLKATDDELAQVIAHEIAHALSEHSREKLSVALAARTAVNVVAAWQGLGQLSSEALGGLATIAIELPNSRVAESEADTIGIRLAAKAGYNPDAASTLWTKMLQLSGESSSAILSTHPLPTERIAALKVEAAQLKPEYEKALSLRTADMLPKIEYQNGTPQNLYRKGRYELPPASQ
jgi:predicted Zn-dependent protease